MRAKKEKKQTNEEIALFQSRKTNSHGNKQTNKHKKQTKTNKQTKLTQEKRNNVN